MTWKDESKIVPDGPKIESCTGGLSRWSSKIESLSSHQPPPSGATVSLQACAMPAEPPPKTGQWIMSWSPLCCDVTEGFSNRSLRTTLLHHNTRSLAEIYALMQNFRHCILHMVGVCSHSHKGQTPEQHQPQHTDTKSITDMFKLNLILKLLTTSNTTGSHQLWLRHLT